MEAGEWGEGRGAEESRRGRTFMPELIRVAGGAYDGELGGGEEGAGGCFGGHFEGGCHRVIEVWRCELEGLQVGFGELKIPRELEMAGRGPRPGNVTSLADCECLQWDR
jgi:hypothetical protein